MVKLKLHNKTQKRKKTKVNHKTLKKGGSVNGKQYYLNVSKKNLTCFICSNNSFYRTGRKIPLTGVSLFGILGKLISKRINFYICVTCGYCFCFDARASKQSITEQS